MLFVLTEIVVNLILQNFGCTLTILHKKFDAMFTFFGAVYFTELACIGILDLIFVCLGLIVLLENLSLI